MDPVKQTAECVFLLLLFFYVERVRHVGPPGERRSVITPGQVILGVRRAADCETQEEDFICPP